MKLHMLKSQTDDIGMSFILETSGGLVVVDGGFDSDAQNLIDTIKTMGTKVDKWILTHAHGDHIGAVCEILQNHPGVLNIAEFVFKFPTDEQIGEYEPTCHNGRVERLRGLVGDVGAVLTVPSAGDVYDMGDCTINILSVPDFEIHDDFLNNSSIVFRADTDSSRVMFLGDLASEGGKKLLEDVNPEELKADYVQMAHHGQDAVERNVYEAIRPDYCMWCTPTWLWDNIGDNGYDTNVYETVIVRGWMSEMKIKKHYIDKDCPVTIEI